MKTQSLHAVRQPISGRRVRFPALVAVTILLFSVLVLRPGSAYGLSCGDTITGNTTLQADLGPCSGVALTVGASNITLSLNGFSIIAVASAEPDCTEVVTPCREGVDVGGTTNVAIKGPGTIRGFSFGVGVFAIDGSRKASSGTTIRHVHFVANSLGIVFVVGAENRILNNTFRNNPCIAIKIDAVTDAQIVGNAINGSNAPPLANSCGMQQSPTGGGIGIMVVSTSTGAIVKQNSVTHSTNGILADSFSSPIAITTNDVSANRQDGIATLSEGTIADNQANGNGRDGISIAVGNGSVVRGNMANSNGRRGIGLGDLLGQPSGNNNRITFNRALGNGTDLVWDGNGAGNCWSRNIFDTSSPVLLPECL